MIERDFIKNLEKIFEAASAAIDSAFMSDDFVDGVNQSLGDISNIVTDSAEAENHADKTDPS